MPRLTPAERAKLKRYGLTRLDKPKMTPKHPRKKAVVATRIDGKVRILRFGGQGYGHNYSPEARRKFKTRHARNIAKGKSSPAWWADKFLWAGKGGSVRRPTKKSTRTTTRRRRTTTRRTRRTKKR